MDTHFPSVVLARVEARRLRIALVVAVALHVLPVLWVPRRPWFSE